MNGLAVIACGRGTEVIFGWLAQPTELGPLAVVPLAANEPYPDAKAQAFPFRRQWR